MTGGLFDLVQGRFRTFIRSGSAMGMQFKEAWMTSQREATSDPSGIFGVPARGALWKVWEYDRREDYENRDHLQRWYHMEVERTWAKLLKGKVEKPV